MTDLTQRRDYLGQNRRMIIGRSLAAAAVGVLPVPVLEEWLSSAVRRGMMRRIADRYLVGISPDAIREIADGAGRSPEWSEALGGSLAFKVVGKLWRRALVGALVVRRTYAAARTFETATLFDHYCARLHTGFDLDATSAAELRTLIDQAIGETPGGITRKMFREGTASAMRAALRTPVDLADRASGGAVRRLLRHGDDTLAATEVDEELERRLSEKNNPLTRATLAVELHLSAERNPYIDNLVDRFDILWRETKNNTP